MTPSKKSAHSLSWLPAALLSVAALIGMIDSFYLVLEYLSVLMHPGQPTPCTINSLISCTKTVQGPWGHYIPGVPNPMLGMLWYSGAVAYGITMLLGTHFSRAARMFVGLIFFAGVVFSYRLYLASVLELAGVCPFCLTSTTASTIILLCYLIDDATSGSPALAKKHRWVAYLFQCFSLATFVFGLPLFIGWNLQWIPDLMPVLSHWSFSVMVVLVLLLLTVHVWAFRRLRRA